MVIRVSVDDKSLDCSDENEVLSAFVADVGTLAGSERPLIMLPLPLYQWRSSLKHNNLPMIIEYLREVHQLFPFVSTLESDSHLALSESEMTCPPRTLSRTRLSRCAWRVREFSRDAWHTMGHEIRAWDDATGARGAGMGGGGEGVRPSECCGRKGEAGALT